MIALPVADATPIIVGVGQHCPPAFDSAAPQSPVDLVAAAARLALADTGQGAALAPAIDVVVFMKLFADMAFMPAPFGGSTRPARSLCQRLGLTPPHVIYSSVGGNLPQRMLNEYAEKIVRGETKAVLLAGGEALRTTAEAQRQGLELNWHEDPEGDMVDLGQAHDLVADVEMAHGMAYPTVSYPMFEQALRRKHGRTVAEQMAAIGRLFEGFNRVAQANPRAAFRTPRSAAEIATVTADNRMIAYPYTRLMNANERVDEAAAVILTSVGMARKLGIDSSRWVYLRGCGDGIAKLRMVDHIDYHSSPALALAAQKALAQAGIGIGDIDFFDLYSCFPSAVELACAALRIAEDDPRPLTVTGGLPFFGGPGNAYVVHSIAETVEWLRQGRGRYGLVTANGGFMSKQSVGIYATEPGTGPWQREDPETYQPRLDAMSSPRLELAPSGPARIETCTVAYERGQPVRGIIIGRLPDDARFVANTPTERPDILQWLQAAEPLGAAGTVSSDQGRNIFVPQGRET